MQRGNGAEIVEVEVPKWFDDFVKENAIPQYKYNSNPLNQGGMVVGVKFDVAGDCDLAQAQGDHVPLSCTKIDRRAALSSKNFLKNIVKNNNF